MVAAQSCDCSWASAYTCATNDGTPCNLSCCMPFRGGISPSPAPSQQQQPSPSPPAQQQQPQQQQPSPAAPSHSKVSWTGKAVTTRYWDCCKPSCSWPSNIGSASGPVTSCGRDGVTPVGANDINVCDGGGDASATAYTCINNQPFVSSSGVLLGFAASNSPCCQCFELLFDDTALAGATMVVQVTNSGGDLGSDHFDLLMPGGGFGVFDGCAAGVNGPAQFGAPTSAWGAQYGGVASASDCAALPPALQPGCAWRFGAFKGADNPSVQFRRVQCPSALISISGCTPSDDAQQPQPSSSSASSSSSGSNQRVEAPTTLRNSAAALAMSVCAAALSIASCV